jgi:hypothetical protein
MGHEPLSTDMPSAVPAALPLRVESTLTAGLATLFDCMHHIAHGRLETGNTHDLIRLTPPSSSLHIEPDKNHHRQLGGVFNT